MTHEGGVCSETKIMVYASVSATVVTPIDLLDNLGPIYTIERGARRTGSGEQDMLIVQIRHNYRNSDLEKSTSSPKVISLYGRKHSGELAGFRVRIDLSFRSHVLINCNK